MRYLHVTLRQPPETRHPMQTFIAECDGVEKSELLHWNFSDPEVEVLLFRVVGDPEPYVAALEADETTREFDVTPIDDRSFYAYLTHEKRESDLEFRRAFAETSLVPVPPIVYTSAGETKFTMIGEQADFRAVLEAIPDRIGVEVERVGEYDTERSGVDADLTDRQREAVAAAVDAGYYAVPREGSVADVAEALDCATSTASNHLRKAEAKVMARLVD